MKIRITVQIEGKTYTAKRPYKDAKYVEVAGVKCPTCGDHVAFTDRDGVIALLVDPDHLEDARETFEGMKVAEVPPPVGPLKLRMPYPAADGDTYTGRAQCVRCKRMVGDMRVKVPGTLFGVEEDERVLLHGRARVY